MDTCLICHEVLDNTKVKLLCGHIFHYECILLSYKSKIPKYSNSIRIDERKCPYCRKDGGYLEIIDTNIPLNGIHKEYDIFIKAMRDNNKDIYETETA